MYNILLKYENDKNLFNKFLESQEFSKAFFECQTRFPGFTLGKKDTEKSVVQIFESLESWIFTLVDENISDIECFAFLDANASRYQERLQDFLINYKKSETQTSKKEEEFIN